MGSSKVYILDHELVSPIAVGKDKILAALKNDLSADRKIRGFDVSGLPFQTAAEVQEDLSEFYSNEEKEIIELCKLDRKLELIVSAYHLSKTRMQRISSHFDPSKTGVILGVGAEVLPLKENEEDMISFIEKDQNAVCELIAKLNGQDTQYNRIGNPYDLYSLYLAEKFNAQAFQRSVLTACVSSTQAIAQGFDMIKRGKAEVVIVGGTDSIVNLIALISFGKLGVIAETDGNISCRPFDNNRKGTIAGEAAGFMILANEDFVKRSGSQPLASVLSYGNTLDGYKITAPDPSGESMSRAIKSALTKSALAPSDIDFYYAHGTGTRQNDGVEIKAFKTALGNESVHIPISSTKDRHGHAIAAAGIQEVCILLELMKHSYIPKNMNLKQPIDADMKILNAPLEKRINFALKSNFAFGGINTTLCLKNEL
jgi:3-oxoacyl-[acyl-carrier-protein] synthase II